MPAISRFDGGLVTGLASIYLNTNQATILLDANIESIGLMSANKPVEIDTGEKSFYQFPILDSEPEAFHITSSNNRRSYAEFGGRLVYSDGGPVSQATDGELVDGDFVWKSLGAKQAEGVIIARPVTVVDDLPGANVTIKVKSVSGVGYITSKVIRYRVVDSEGTVYIHDIDNSGYATVEWILPDDTYTVYRELTDIYGNTLDRFAQVSVGEATFTDGTFVLETGFSYTYADVVRDYSGHRMSVHNARSWTSPYTIVRTDELVTVSVTELRGVGALDDWKSLPFNQTITLATDDADIVAIASTFVFAGDLYVMMRLGEVAQIFKSDGTLVFETDIAMDTEFFKGTTVEHNTFLYMFSPSTGQVAVFDGLKVVYREMDAFPYAKAEDTVYSLRGDIIYAVINAQHESNVRKITLPSLEVGLAGEERIRGPLVRGLGGTSGSDLVNGEFNIFPLHGGTLLYSPTSNQVIAPADVSPEVGSCNITGYAYHGSFFHSIQNKECVITDPRAYLTTATEDYTLILFNERTLSGTYVYNVAQESADGLSEGPIMDTQSDPVTVYKGHIIIDVSAIIHEYPLKLYRTGGYLTRFTMVEDTPLASAPLVTHEGVTVTNDGVNVTNEEGSTAPTSYIDKRDDVTIALGRNGLHDFADAPPEGLKFLTAHRGRLFGVVGSKLYWSEAGDANKWDELYSFVLMDRDVTGLASCVNGLLIFMRGRINILLGDDRNSFSMRTVSLEKGTTDSFSIQSVGNGALFFSADGLCFTDGAQIQEISYSVLGPQRFDCVDSAATNRSYYALIKGYTNGAVARYLKILRYDFGKEPVFSKLSGDGINGLGTVFGRLSHSSKGIIYDTLGGTARKLNYRSGNITEGIPTMKKEWDRVRVAGEFIGTLIVYMEDRIAINEEINLKRDGLINFQFPKSANKGKTIAFELVGRGYVSSIEYSVTARKTTK